MSGARNARENLLNLFSEAFMETFPASTDDVRMEDVAAWDSVSHHRLVLDIEAAYGISLSDEEVVGIVSLSDAERVLAGHGVPGFSASGVTPGGEGD